MKTRAEEIKSHISGIFLVNMRRVTVNEEITLAITEKDFDHVIDRIVSEAIPPINNDLNSLDKLCRITITQGDEGYFEYVKVRDVEKILAGTVSKDEMFEFATWMLWTFDTNLISIVSPMTELYEQFKAQHK